MAEKPTSSFQTTLRDVAAWVKSPAGIVLALLVLQSTSAVLLMRYSSLMDRPESAGPAYLATVAVFMAEALKLPFCLGMAAWFTRNDGGLWQLLRTEYFGKPLNTLKCGVPAIAYTIQSNLLFVALANLEPPMFQVTYQCKTIFTAIFCRILLDKRLQYSQWIALLLLVSGEILATDFKGEGSKENQSVHVGLVAVVVGGLLSASASVYFEKMLKTPFEGAAAKAGLWLRNIQLGSFALPLACIAMFSKDSDRIAKYGLMQGFDNGVIWTVVVLNGLGGLLVAATMKYADNIVKCFATAIAIVVGTVLSIPIFDFTPSELFAVGATVTVLATILYSAAPKQVCPCRFKSTKESETTTLLDDSRKTAPLVPSSDAKEAGKGVV